MNPSMNESMHLYNFSCSDLFVLREDGYGRIVGRLKDIINRGGQKIYPKEVEDVLSEMPPILEVCVLGVPDRRLGEEICAFIRLKNKKYILCPSEIKNYCQDKLAPYKIPRKFQIVEEYPKNSLGKIQKHILKELLTV